MTTIALNQGEAVQIPFTINDSANGLAGKRVTWSVAEVAGGARVLHKQSLLPGSSADITITSQTAAAISGTINVSLTDIALLTKSKYYATLWVDDGASYMKCATAGGVDTITISGTVPQVA